MAIKVTLFGGPKKKKNYQLTAKGQKRAEEFNVTGNRGEVVAALDRLETGTLSEIANEAKLSTSKTRNIIDALVGDGWIMVAGGE